MTDVTIHQLQCFDAVVSEGSFQAAADKLLRAQPSVSLAVKNLETQLSLSLLDRSGYRVSLTDAGRSFHARANARLRAMRDPRQRAAHSSARFLSGRGRPQLDGQRPAYEEGVDLAGHGLGALAALPDRTGTGGRQIAVDRRRILQGRTART